MTISMIISRMASSMKLGTNDYIQNTSKMPSRTTSKFISWQRQTSRIT